MIIRWIQFGFDMRGYPITPREVRRFAAVNLKLRQAVDTLLTQNRWNACIYTKSYATNVVWKFSKQRNIAQYAEHFNGI